MLRIVSLGELAADPRFFRQYAHGMTSYPLGYTIERSVFTSGRSSRTKVIFPGDTDEVEHIDDIYYTASIKQGPTGGPLFEIVRSDKPDIIHSGESPSVAWRGALEAAEKDFSSRVDELAHVPRDAHGLMVIQGQKWYGLTLDSVIAKVQSLPGSEIIFRGSKNSRSSSKSNKTVRVNKEVSSGSASTQKSKKGKETKDSTDISRQHSEDVSESLPAVKKRKTSIKSSSITTIDDEDIPFSVLAAGKATGIQKACPDCGLTTMFCPLTGKPHSIGESKQKKQNFRPTVNAEGESKIKTSEKGSKTSRVSKKEKSESTGAIIIGSNNTTDDEKIKRKFTRKRKRDDDTNELEKSSSEPPINTEKKKRGQRKSIGEESIPDSLEGNKKQNKKQKLDGVITDTSDSEDIPLVLRLMKSANAQSSGKEIPPPAPLWRPPLGTQESNKALQVLQRIIRSEDVVQVPFASLLHLPQIPGSRGRVGRKKVSETDNGNDQRETTDFDNMMEEINNRADPATSMEINNKNKKTEDNREKHPLDILDVGISVAGKRYVKFIQQYTSERAKVDLLKKADAVPPVSRKREVVKKQTEKSDEIVPPQPTGTEGEVEEQKQLQS